MTLDPSFYPVWAYFALMIKVMALAALPAFKFLDSAPRATIAPTGQLAQIAPLARIMRIAQDAAGSHYTAIEGLRGFLALGVFVFHLIVTRDFIITGQWDVPASRFHALLGPVGVSLFFMITGFLFWGKLLRTAGEPGWLRLYVGRLFRIGPMYLFVVLVMLAIVFARTGWQLQAPAGAVAVSALQWLALGFIDSQPNVNGYPATHVLAGVTWTIWYEWAFYASLPVLALFARARTQLLLIIAALAFCLMAKMIWHVDALGFSLLFLCGMAVASLLHHDLKLRLQDNLGSALALACLIAIFATSRSGYGTWTAGLLALFFYFIASGTTLFGLLTTSPARRLGAVSYSLYLMQGLVLTLVFAIAPIRSAAIASPLMYWAAGILCVTLLFLAAAAGFALIERPGITFGKRLLRYRTEERLGTGPQDATGLQDRAGQRSSNGRARGAGLVQ